MAITIDIDTARPYQVHVGTFLLEQAGPLVRATAGGTKAVIVTDTNVGPLYQMPVKQSLEASGYEVSICTFEAGEAHKRAETYVAILEFVAEHELSRSDVIVALGGGVVGDVAGFVAATYMRGCKFVQIPTSLLAMVDSSVGGKTAIDLAAGKNLAGAFWQPSVVIADVGCLATLTPEQFADGCGEVVKHAVIADPELFAELEKTIAGAAAGLDADAVPFPFGGEIGGVERVEVALRDGAGRRAEEQRAEIHAEVVQLRGAAGGDGGVELQDGAAHVAVAVGRAGGAARAREQARDVGDLFF